MIILFINMSSLRFTAATPDHEPLGGSETSLCYLGRALVKRGHEVAFAINLPEETPETVEGIRHYPLSSITDAPFFADTMFDLIVLCNAPAAGLSIKAKAPGARLFLWAHVLPDQASMQSLTQEEVRHVFDQVIFVSHWQQQEIERAFGHFRATQVIGNGIAPVFENMFASAEELLAAKQNRAIYASTPYRGLSVLVRAMEKIDRPIKLDVFSSMRVYQSGDDEYVPLFTQAAQNANISCHGSVAQKTLAQYCHVGAFLFYPSIYPETFCIVVAEAMAAGMDIVTTRLGALEETTMGCAALVSITSNDGDILVQDFTQAMQGAVDWFTDAPEAWSQTMFAQMLRANAIFTWAARAAVWEAVFK